MDSSAALPRLSRQVDERSAQRFVEVVGRRSALLGNELGVFECWIWPLKICHDLRFAFRTGGATLALADVAREVAIDPFALEIRFEHTRVRGKLSAFAALERRALAVLFEIESSEDLAMEIELTLDFRPMWPAGLGGQLVRPDPESGALLLTEELGRCAALLGSPGGALVTSDAERGMPRGAPRFSIPVPRARAAAGPIPFFIAGAEVEPAALSAGAGLGGEGAALGLARAGPVLERVRAEYRHISERWREEHAEQTRHWRGFLARTTEIESDEPGLADAFQWSKIAIERAWVEVEGLGRGLVAGLARSGAGERPGFGWFFDGDALCAARAMCAYGDHAGARAVLEFAASHQRADGKLMHELVLSARWIDWVRDYPYAYYKGVNTPDFLSALEHYVASAADGADVLERLWKPALAALAHVRACVGADGLYSVRKAGLAAVEAGPLADKLESEIFAHGLYLEALGAMARLARARRDADLEGTLAADELRAVRALAHLRDPARDVLGFARLVDGTLVPDVTGYHGEIGLLTPSLGDASEADLELEETVAQTVAHLNRPELASDWGVRMFPTTSPIYDPEHYNTGAVFPYLSAFCIRALFAWSDARAAHQLLRAVVGLSGFAGLGLVPEHLRGDRAVQPARGVPHQIFSSAAIPTSVLGGLAGLRSVDGVLVIAPALSLALARLAVRGVRIGESLADVAIARTRTGRGTELAIEVLRREGPALAVRCAPSWPLCTRFLEARWGRQRWRADDARAGDEFEPLQDEELRVDERAEFHELALAGPDLWFEPAPLVEGRASEDLRHGPVQRSTSAADGVTWTLWGRAGRTYRGRFHSDVQGRLAGAQLSGPGEIEVRFPPGPQESWSAIDVRFRPS